MKSTANNLAPPIAALALIATVQIASAMYDPSTQKWINRDPINDIAFKARVSSQSKLQRVLANPENDAPMLVAMQRRTVLGDGPNAFLAMHNGPINSVDSFGLTACTDMCDNDFDQRFHNCTGYANTAAKAGAVGGAVGGGILGGVTAGPEGAVCGAVVVGAIDAAGFYVLTKAGCRYAAFIARGACYAGCMSAGDW